MSQTENTHGSGYTSLEGKEFYPANRTDLNEAIRLAFDYRGDTTLELKDGRKVDGFLYNIDPIKGLALVFVKEGKDSISQTVKYDDIKGVLFTGDDTAFGKSWDDWSTKSAKQREEEVERARLLAAKLGHL